MAAEDATPRGETVPAHAQDWRRCCPYDLIPKNRSTKGVNPYPVGVTQPSRANEFKAVRWVCRGRRMNRALPALVPSTGLLLNSPLPIGSNNRNSPCYDAVID